MSKEQEQNTCKQNTKNKEIYIIIIIIIITDRDSAVSVATGYVLDDRGVGVRVPVEGRFFSPPQRPDRLRGPPSLLSNGYRGIFPRE
jgi:hypothetical protein